MPIYYAIIEERRIYCATTLQSIAPCRSAGHTGFPVARCLADAELRVCQQLIRACAPLSEATLADERVDLRSLIEGMALHSWGWVQSEPN